MAHRSVRPTVRWATAAATLTLLPPSTIAASGGAFEPSQRVSASMASGALARVAADKQTSTAEIREEWSPLGLDAQVLFVAGPTKNVRFRIDLRDKTLSTPSTPKLLEGVVDVLVAKRLMFLCQADFSVGSAAPSIVAFDLETGLRIRGAGSGARAPSIDATFCTPKGRPSHPRAQDSGRLQNI